MDVVFVDSADLDVEFFCERYVEMGRGVKGAFERIDLAVCGAGKFAGEPVAFDDDVDAFGLVDSECDSHLSAPWTFILLRQIRIGFADEVDAGRVLEGG